jgi:hypothetical protein
MMSCIVQGLGLGFEETALVAEELRHETDKDADHNCAIGRREKATRFPK